MSFRIRQSLLASTLAALISASALAADRPATGSMIDFSALPWEPLPGMPVMMAKLWGDRAVGAYGVYFKIPPGFVAGSHAHTADYQGINLQGTWVHTMNGETRELRPGSHVFQPGGQYHDDACKGPEECILLIMQSAKGDYIPEPK